MAWLAPSATPPRVLHFDDCTNCAECIARVTALHERYSLVQLWRVRTAPHLGEACAKHGRTGIVELTQEGGSNGAWMNASGGNGYDVVTDWTEGAICLLYTSPSPRD